MQNWNDANFYVTKLRERFFMQSKIHNPRVTVLMPVYNGEAFLKEAIDSILNQTYQDFEFLIINDGSKDKSVEIIKSYDDSRINLINNETNLGVALVRNRGLELAKGEYVVFMDCDDISVPERIEKQVKFMDNNPTIGVCGSEHENFGENIKSYIIKNPLDHDSIKSALFFFCAINNGTAIIRKSFLDKNDLKYCSEFPHIAEDFDLWIRCSFCFELRNLPELLYKYRQVSSSVTHTYIEDKQKKCLLPIYQQNLNYLGIEATEENIDIYHEIYTTRLKPTKNLLNKIEEFLVAIKKVNSQKHIYPEPAFSKAIARRWFLLCFISSELGLYTFFKYLKSALTNFSSGTLEEKIKFPLKCLFKHKNKDF